MRNPRRSNTFWIIAAPIVLSLSAPALAQCPFTSSMVEAYSAAGFPTAGQRQNAASGWTYERSGASGLERTLLEGIEPVSWTCGAWGSPGEQYFVPCAGGRYSPIPAHNQIPFYRRTPSIEGILLHPGFGAQHSRAVLKVQGGSTLDSLTVRAEDLGNYSPNVVVGVVLRRVDNSVTTLIAPTFVLSLAPAVALSPAPGLLPLPLAPGDRVEIESSDGGDASEDWLNVNVTAGLSGPPLIESQPVVHANCSGPTTATVVAAGATSYRWSRDGTPLSDGPGLGGSVVSGSTSATLSIDAFAPQDVGLYTCQVGNGCGSVTSSATPISLCFADFNGDGFMDFFDYDDFVNAFETGDVRADVNGDGFADFFDYDDYVGAFETGC